MGRIILLRHGQSEGSAANRFQGSRWDPSLTDVGRQEARDAAVKLRAHGVARVDFAWSSALVRAQETLEIVLEELGQAPLPRRKAPELNEKDYGDLTGMEKDEARSRFGTEQVHRWRRTFENAPPGGESLKMTAERVHAYYHAQIEPKLFTDASTTLVVAHGNSLRCVMMALEGLSGEDVCKVELKTGIPYVYELASGGNVLAKHVLS